jgi:hypothetical protein
VPCREFYAQLVDPRNPEIRKLYDQYVLMRVTDLRGIDVGLYDFDPDSTLYTFVINADERVLLRYGGRDDAAHESYFSEKSLQRALERGLEQFQMAKAGKLGDAERPKARFPGEYPDVKRDTIDKNKCVHCHHMGSGKTRAALAVGGLDKLKDMWVYPEIGSFGISVDRDNPTVATAVEDAAREAGMKVGDEIRKIAGEAIFTYGDMQERLDKVAVDAKTLEIVVSRKDGEKELKLKLPELWRVTKIERRSSVHALEPFPEFWGKELNAAARKKLGIQQEDFACEVTKFWVKTNAQAAGMQPGDVVTEIDGVTSSEYTTNPVLWIRLNRKAGDTVKIKVIRDGKTLEFSFKLKAKPW